MIENELTNLSALIGSIKNNAEKIQASEDSRNLIEGIINMCNVASNKLSLVKTEISEVRKDV